jgi:hypothetical protein
MHDTTEETETDANGQGNNQSPKPQDTLRPSLERIFRDLKSDIAREIAQGRTALEVAIEEESPAALDRETKLRAAATTRAISRADYLATYDGMIHMAALGILMIEELDKRAARGKS